MAVRVSKPKPQEAPPLFVAALRACVGRDPGFLRQERLATSGPFAWLHDWSALDDLLVAAADEGVAA